MTVDRKYLRNALKELAASSGHEMGSYELAKALGLCLGADCKIDQVALDKFVSHIRFLNDEYFIECGAQDLGFSKTMSGMSIYKTRYRITSRGINFLTELDGRFKFGPVVTWSLSLLEEAVRKPLVLLIRVAIFALLLLAVNFVYHHTAKDDAVQSQQSEVAR